MKLRRSRASRDRAADTVTRALDQAAADRRAARAETDRARAAGARLLAALVRLEVRDGEVHVTLADRGAVADLFTLAHDNAKGRPEGRPCNHPE